MWNCPECNQKFIYQNVRHSCNERSVEDFTKGKSDHTSELFNYFIEEYLKIGEIVLHPAKSRIALAADIRFAYIHRLGKNYVDIVFQFRNSYNDNFCFYKIAQIPESTTFNHYFRMENKDDLNTEVRDYMKKAYDIGKRLHLK